MNETLLKRSAGSLRVGVKFALRDLQAEFRSGRLGAAWMFITPLLWTFAFVAVRSGLEAKGVKLPSGDLPGPVFALIGVLVFQSWFDPFRNVLSAFTRNKAFIKFIGVAPEMFLYAEITRGIILTLPRMAIGATALLLFSAEQISFSGIACAGAVMILAALNGSILGFLLAPFASLGSDIRNLVQSLSLAFLAASGAFVSVDAIVPDALTNLFTAYPGAVWVDIARNAVTGSEALFPIAGTVWAGMTLLLWPVSVLFASAVRPILAEKMI